MKQYLVCILIVYILLCGKEQDGEWLGTECRVPLPSGRRHGSDMDQSGRPIAEGQTDVQQDRYQSGSCQEAGYFPGRHSHPVQQGSTR